MDYSRKIANYAVDVTAVWRLQTKNLYSSTNLGALAVREMLQNSIDACRAMSRKIGNVSYAPRIDIKVDGDTIEVTDNGIGMTVSQLHTKFLSLGGTSKSGESVGGFGVAKAVILGCGDSWEIYTQDNYLSSDMIGKSPVKKIPERNKDSGTTIRIHGVQAGTNRKITDMGEAAFLSAVKEYVCTSNLQEIKVHTAIHVYINGRPATKWFHDNRGRVQLPFTLGIGQDCIPDDTRLTIKFYNNKELSGDATMGGESRGYYVWVRLNGLTQFKSYIGWDCKCDAVVDFSTKLDPKDPRYPFGTSREQLKNQCAPIVEHITRELLNNPQKNSGDQDWDVTLYADPDIHTSELRAVSKVIFSEDMFNTLQALRGVVQGIDKRRHMERRNLDQNVMMGTEYSAPEHDEWVEPIETQSETMFDSNLELTKELVENGMEAQMQTKGVSVLDQLIQLTEYQRAYADNLSAVTGLQPEEVNTNLINPISCSWIILENNRDLYQYKRMNKKWLPRLVVTWDTILRMLMLNFTNNDYKPRFDFYPGIINSAEAGLCMERPSRDYRVINFAGKQEVFGWKCVYVMFNPFMTPAMDDMSTALYLMNLGCHELAHFLAGCQENHGERWAQLREVMFNANVPYVSEFLKVVKASKLRLVIGKVTGNTDRMPHQGSTVSMTKGNVQSADPRKAALKAIPNERLEAFIYDRGTPECISRLESFKGNKPNIYRMRLVMAYNETAKHAGDIYELQGL